MARQKRTTTPAEPEDVGNHQASERVPVCPYCQRPCARRRSEPYFTRYDCPGCPYSEKVARPTIGQEVARSVQQDAQDAFDARPGRDDGADIPVHQRGHLDRFRGL